MAHDGNEVVALEGWLYKRGQKHQNWKRRWFVLKTDSAFGGHLHYYAKPKPEKGSSSLTGPGQSRIKRHEASLKGLIPVYGAHVSAFQDEDAQR